MGRHALDPQQWGWGLVEGRLDPKTTGVPAATDTLQKLSAIAKLRYLN